ncbi:MAG: hypothetical protein HKO98_05685 [Gemmatimonadetes bacterium]|nr:hypothetical protein [Gemmatimonadota bacterium]
MSRGPRLTALLAGALLAGVVLAGVALAAGPLAGQQEARPELRGEVTRGGEIMPGAEIVLHRVSATQAGEIDTVQADAAGRFLFSLPSVPREDQEGDVYFASIRHDGILYFGRAVSRAVQLDSVYAIRAYDTLVAPPAGTALPVGVRYLIAEDGAEGWQITDLFEIAHEGDRTWVAAPGGITWSHPLPAAARDPQVGGGDVSRDAAVVEDGVLLLSGPISPGARQFILRYRVDSLDGLDVPLAPGTRVAELLVREPAPDLEVEGLPGVETVEMQPGVTFRRYAAEPPQVDRIRVTVGEPPAQIPMEWLTVGLGLLLAIAGLYAVGRGGGAGTPAPAYGTPAGAAPFDPVDARNRILLEIARIDQRLDDEGLDAQERARLESERAAKVAHLSGGA